MEIRPITPDFAVAPQIFVGDVAEIARLGYRTLICNRPDGEVMDQPDYADIARAAQAAGMTVHFLPISHREGITAETISALEDILGTAEAPVLAYCRSGTRSTMAWGIAMAASEDPNTLIQAAANAGYDLSPLFAAMEARRR